MSNVIEKAVSWALTIADNPGHGYDQLHRWGADYDCSSLVISAYEQAGVLVKTQGATYTGNMRPVFLRCGFTDVTKSVDLATGKGLQRGDVLLHEVKHTALYLGGGKIVHASANELGKATGGKTGDQTGGEICTRSYYNFPWQCVLRYTAEAHIVPPMVSVKLQELSRGCTNGNVGAMQTLLTAKGYNCGGIDEDFGEKTFTALCKFQADIGLTVDGECGVKTWAALMS